MSSSTTCLVLAFLGGLSAQEPPPPPPPPQQQQQEPPLQEPPLQEEPASDGGAVPDDAPAAPDPPEEKSERKRLVAVLDLKATPGESGMALALGTVLTAEIAALPGYAALSRNEMKAIVAHQADASLAGCDTPQCVGNLAKLMDADLVVTGSVERITDAIVFSLTLVDPSGPTVIGRQEVAWRSDPDEMVALARPYALRLLGGPESAHLTGSLEVLALDGASVFVDGAPSGTTPLGGPVEGLAMGAHRVLVRKDGCGTVTRDVVIAHGESTILHADLVEEPFYTRWWFWTATGGTVLAAGGLAAGVTTWAMLNQDTPTHLVVGAKR